MFQRLLALPETENLDVDGVDRLEVHAAVLRRKPMLAAVFRECHELMLHLDRRTFGDTPGLRIELGAGVAPIAGTIKPSNGSYDSKFGVCPPGAVPDLAPDRIVRALIVGILATG